MSLLFTPFFLPSARGGIHLPNRITVAPMCQYAAVDGCASDWHVMHWGNLLNSGAAMFTIEATAVLPQGRITPGCLGLWDTVTEAALADRLHRARKLAPPVAVCIQLAHAGRKASSALPWHGGQLLGPQAQGWVTCGPSALPQLPGEAPPVEMNGADMARVRDAFVQAARRADAMGIEAIEIHCAHGYLLHEFLSPVANQRGDAYGGSLDNRMRFPLEVFAAVRAAFDGVLGIRISGSDWVDGGWDIAQCTVFGQRLRQLGCDFIHMSSGGVSPQQKIPLAPGYQVPFAEKVRKETGITTGAVGMIVDPHHAERILAEEKADFIAVARAMLFNPRWALHAALTLGEDVGYAPQYNRAHPAAWPPAADLCR